MSWELPHDIEGLDEDGRPDPAYAAALGLRPAPLGRRAIAGLIDVAGYALLQLPFWLVVLPTLLEVVVGTAAPAAPAGRPDVVWMVVATAVSAVLTLAYVIVQLTLHGRSGVTLGKALTHIRSVHVATLARPGIGRALLRGLALAGSFLVPLIGPLLVLLSPLLDGEKRGRGWLDMAGATWFVDTKLGLDPYHEKRMRVARKTVRAEAHAAGVQPAPPVARDGGRRRGGYRPGELSGRASVPEQPSEHGGGRAVTPATAIGGIVERVPGREATQQPMTPSVQHAAQQSHAQPQPEARPEPEPAPGPGAAPFSEETLLDFEADRGAEVARGGADDDIDDSTVRRVDHAEHDDVDVTRVRRAAVAPIATLAFDVGDRFSITGSALIGRNPAASPGEVVEHLLPVADDTRSISKTHLLITASPLAAVDRASTNGSSVVRAGVEHPLTPGHPFELAVGDVVRFGDRSVAVEPGSGGGVS